MRRLSRCLLAGASLLPLAPAHAEEAANPADILVTAQKREEKAQDVPFALSVVSQSTLNALGVSELGEMAAYVPGLQIQKQSASQPGFVIRGITSDNGSAQAGSRVSVYYNGVDISRARGAWQDLFDMERIEVAKGPQATLFGTAAEVGAVSMISAQPRSGLSGAIHGTYGNYNRTRIDGFLNAGNDKLAGRIAFSHKYRHGYIQNLAAGQDDLNGQNDWSARASLRWTPSSRVSVLAVLTYDRQRDTGTSFTSLSYPTSAGVADPFAAAQLSGSPYGASVLGQSKLGLKRQVYDGNVTANIDLGGGITFTTINAYRQFKSQEVVDGDGSRAFMLEFGEDAQGEQFNHEARLQFEAKRWHATLGWNVFVENGFQKVPFSTEEGTFLACAVNSSFASLQAALRAYGVGTGTSCVNGNGVASNALGMSATYLLTRGARTSLPYSSVYTNKGVNRTYSMFADSTWAATPRLELTAGARLLIEDRKSSSSSIQPNSALLALYGIYTPLLGLANSNGAVLTSQKSFSPILPRFSLLYRLRDGVNLYATAAKGRYSPVVQFATSSVNGTLVASPQVVPAESLWNYEMGIKGRMGAFSGSLSAFYQAYDGFQITVTTNGIPTTQSAGKANNPGIEAEGSWQITPVLSANGMVSWMKARINGQGANAAYAGQRMRLQPDYSAALSLNLRVPVGDRLLAYVVPDWTYRSSVHFEIPNNPATSQAAYALYNARAGVEFGRDRRFALGAYIRNIGNRHYWLDAGNIGSSFGNPTYIAGEPRLYGMEASARF
ncbi:TonB-dependent receptor [Novosphingobium umbonatum]|uniref:TonB-dependent receptor n=1 Tax=Novosphingobium umbonatum TaxID=1908524 RepID=A0A437N7C3_9SPHN|nr:TonB-dependent receptor [Novosphingobium umbonatum]RVU05803.1 TonB-dependent receptor [Novosphingobium umbonatum]